MVQQLGIISVLVLLLWIIFIVGEQKERVGICNKLINLVTHQALGIHLVEKKVNLMNKLSLGELSMEFINPPWPNIPLVRFQTATF